MVIVIALVIGILCSSLIAMAYFYRIQYQYSFRSIQLQRNLGSAVNILLASSENDFPEETAVSLFGTQNDSVLLKIIPWGVYDVAVAKATIQKDTLYKVFSMANEIDSAKWAAMYLIDEDRPVSVSGKTRIEGYVFIPKAGVRQAYVDNKSYEGDSRLIIGKKHDSARELPKLDAQRLLKLERYFAMSERKDILIPTANSQSISFLSTTRIINFRKKPATLENLKLNGNILVLSDTLLTIASTAQLSNVMVIAKAIRVENGFIGNCQLLAQDSISIGSDCNFSYPSAIGVFRNHPATMTQLPEQINIGDRTKINGVIFSHEQGFAAQKQPIIALGNNVQLNGQIYAEGRLTLKDNAKLSGSIFTRRFNYQSGFTQYENYIINTTINSTELSPYYLSSDLLPVVAKQKKILQWLEAN